MIIEKNIGRYIIWNSKDSSIKRRPLAISLYFNNTTNELEFVNGNLFKTFFSIQELTDMLRELKRVNKKGVLIK